MAEKHALAARFFSALSSLYQAELADNAPLARSILSSLPTHAAPAEWAAPFTTSAFCQTELLAACPAIFWRRLSRRFPELSEDIAAVSAAIGCAEDLLDTAEPDTHRLLIGALDPILLTEGSYATGGVGRHVYAAAMALATVLSRQKEHAAILPPLCGSRVLELGCGLGLVGIAAALCGAASVLLTDSAEASVRCAAANAELNGLSCVRSTRLDWGEFASAEGAELACEAAGLGAVGGSGLAEWPDVILAGETHLISTESQPLLSPLLLP